MGGFKSLPQLLGCAYVFRLDCLSASVLGHILGLSCTILSVPLKLISELSYSFFRNSVSSCLLDDTLDRCEW